MKRILVVLVMASVIAMTGIAWGASGKVQKPSNQPHHKPVPASCTVQALRPFSAQVWASSKWERGMPSKAVTEAYARRLGCAPPAHKRAMKKTWRRDKKAFVKYRSQELFRVNVTPYRCGNTYWATECTIPEHESGYGSGGSNLYGMKDAWAEHGCTVFAPTADTASKRDQDICARRHWEEYGRGGWPSY